MSKKKDTEIEIRDTETGAELKVGKKTVATINEENGQFIVLLAGKEVALSNSFETALEEAIKSYNLSV